jgi:Tol biopolymer transport system component
MFYPVLSLDGRYVAFESSVNDLVDNDNVCVGPCDGNNGVGDVFLRDLVNSKTVLVSVNRTGTNGGNSGSSQPSISADGRLIAFGSFATDLVSNDSTPQRDIYVRDLSAGITTLVTVNNGGTGAGTNGGGVGMNSYDPQISANGRFVAFSSSDVDLVPNKTNVLPSDVFVRDLFTNQTSLVSANRSGNDNHRDEKTQSVPRVFSGDGRFLVFYSTAVDLLPNDTGPQPNIFVRDLFTQTTSLVDVNLGGVGSSSFISTDAHIPRDGRLIIFQSLAADLVEGDTNNQYDVFARTVFAENPIDDRYFLVRQQYVDFLGREPDAAGEDFWIKELSQCGNDQGCLEAKRINVSAAFFLSIEFQQTGYFVERTYKGAYGDAKGTSTWSGSHQLDVPIVRFNEFLSDTQKIGQDVVVLQSGWEQKLESNKQAFFLDFVQRPRFTVAFPDSITPEQFVDRLNQNAGNVLSPTERSQAVNLFGGSSYANNKTACAQALRLVAENQNFNASEFNRAFVLMQYFGYLRRNPDDAPESSRDYSGYDFWLTKLNNFHGNYIDAEMVEAFITSIEYRQRFAL